MRFRSNASTLVCVWVQLEWGKVGEACDGYRVGDDCMKSHINVCVICTNNSRFRSHPIMWDGCDVGPSQYLMDGSDCDLIGCSLRSWWQFSSSCDGQVCDRVDPEYVWKEKGAS